MDSSCNTTGFNPKRTLRYCPNLCCRHLKPLFVEFALFIGWLWHQLGATHGVEAGCCACAVPVVHPCARASVPTPGATTRWMDHGWMAWDYWEGPAVARSLARRFFLLPAHNPHREGGACVPLCETRTTIQQTSREMTPSPSSILLKQTTKAASPRACIRMGMGGP